MIKFLINGNDSNWNDKNDFNQTPPENGNNVEHFHFLTYLIKNTSSFKRAHNIF